MVAISRMVVVKREWCNLQVATLLVNAFPELVVGDTHDLAIIRPRQGFLVRWIELSTRMMSAEGREQPVVQDPRASWRRPPGDGW
jgi:hypothetical protein